MNASRSVFEQLMDVLADRKTRRPEKSYTTQLFAGGVEKVGSKINEEAAEVVAAAGEVGAQGTQHLVHEAADLVYHLFAMLALCDVPLAALEAELARRFGTSGLDEKASRPDSQK